MSKEEVYNYIKRKTHRIKCLNLQEDCETCRGTGNQVISAREINQVLQIREQTIYANLKNLDVESKKMKITRIKEGKTHTFNLTYYWISSEEI